MTGNWVKPEWWLQRLVSAGLVFYLQHHSIPFGFSFMNLTVAFNATLFIAKMTKIDTSLLPNG